MNLKRLSLIAPPAVALLFAAAVVYAATTTLVVYPGNLEGWAPRTVAGSQPSPSPTPQVLFVLGPTPAPLNRGSVEFRVGSDGDAAAELRHAGFAGTVLPTPTPTPDPELPPPPPPSNELTALSYSTYAQSGGSGGQAPYIILQIDTDGDSGVEDLLFFEPVYQGVTFCPSNPQASVTVGQWQTWEAFNGCWYSVFGTAGSGPGTNVKSLRTIAAALTNPQIINSASGLGGVRIVTGFGAGAWDNFIGNVDAFGIGVGADAEGEINLTRYDFEPTAPPTPSSTGVIISEFRTSGPGSGVEAETSESSRNPLGAIGMMGSEMPTGRVLARDALADEIGGPEGLPVEERGSAAPPCCDEDDYIELYNTSNTDIAVVSSDGSAGWALVKRGATCLAPPVIVAVIPNGTVIPARGHYLVAGSEFSLSDYPGAEPGSTPSGTQPDQQFSEQLDDDNNIGLFNTSDSSNFNLSTRLDAVGFDAGSGSTCELLSEGSKLLAPRGSTAEHAFVRKMGTASGGLPQDTNDNGADFATVSTNPDLTVGDNPTPILGAPGPENTSSPVNRNGSIGNAPIAPTVALTAAPNRERVFDNDPLLCSTFGSLIIRRTFTNNTGADVTRLRFRVVDITTYNSPIVVSGAQADLRVRESADETIAVPGRGMVNVIGLVLEQPPDQSPPICGGLNSSLSVNQITMSSPLAPGASVDVAFRLGVMQTGLFRFFFNIEGLP